MKINLDYSTIGWEQFENLCIDLWFDEGYKEIKPYGRHREGGRDAIYDNKSLDELTIFQFKRWTGNYSSNKLIDMIRKASKKISKFNPSKFILNSCQEPNAKVNESIIEIENELGFTIEYWDKSWIDLRLNNLRQDLRRNYFGINLEHHSFISLLNVSTKSTNISIQGYNKKFIKELYVQRTVEEKYFNFIESDKLCFAISDKSGTGKSNLICNLSMDLLSQQKVVVLIDAKNPIPKNLDLVDLICNELGYSSSDWENSRGYLENISKLLKSEQEYCYVFIDSISESDNSKETLIALKKLLDILTGLDTFKICFSCRDIFWFQVINILLPDFLYYDPKNPDILRFSLGNFSDFELESAISAYSNYFNLIFSFTNNSKNQIRHPLLLRLFCETNKNKKLGVIDSIPISDTFDEYISQKSLAVSNRIYRVIPTNLVEWLLINIAGSMWNEHNKNNIFESEIKDIKPEHIDNDLGILIVRLLEEEGILNTKKQIHNPDKSISFEFEELKEYLQLKYFITKLPKEFSDFVIIEDLPKKLINYFKENDKNKDAVRFATLIGIILSDQHKREDYLKFLLKWDFQIFSNCLTYIPPTGIFSECTNDSLFSFSNSLLSWYKKLIELQFVQINHSVEPWCIKAMNSTNFVGIDLTASPNCKEITYKYTIEENINDIVKINMSEDYPTWSISFIVDDKEMKMHDPENGVFISLFRGGGMYAIRTLNLPFNVPYPGASINVPERLALFDVWLEIKDLLKNNYLPYNSTIMVEELARSIAQDINNIESIKDLTYESLKPQEKVILSAYISNEAEHAIVSGKFRKLLGLLEVLKKPLGNSLLPISDEKPKMVFDALTLSNDFLLEYLTELFQSVFFSIQTILSMNFPNLEDQLNLSSQYPFDLVIITDKINVKIFIIPVEDSSKVEINCSIVDPLKFKLDDPRGKLRIDGLEFNDFVYKNLKSFGKNNQFLHPIEKTIPFNNCFSSTPINDIAINILESEFRGLLHF